MIEKTANRELAELAGQLEEGKEYLTTDGKRVIYNGVGKIEDNSALRLRFIKFERGEFNEDNNGPIMEFYSLNPQMSPQDECIRIELGSCSIRYYYPDAIWSADNYKRLKQKIIRSKNGR